MVVVLLAILSSALYCKAAGNLLGQAAGISDWIVGHRRALHKIPELAYNEHETSKYLRNVLDDMDVKYRFPVAKTGIVADIGSGRSPIVLLRADMDALAIQEPEGLPFRSLNPGVMHACGHDGHMAMLLGAVKLLKAEEATLQGTVRIVFQPAEEGPAGAKQMIAEGILKKVDVAFAQHVMPTYPAGVFLMKEGTVMSASQRIAVKVTGQGGHAAIPHNTRDPVVAGSAIISALQTLVSRETSPLSPAVISITTAKASDAFNVIPDVFEFGGTIRASTTQEYEQLRSGVARIASGVAEAFRVKAEVTDGQTLYVPTVNDPATAQLANAAAAELLGKDKVQPMVQLMTGEDFGFIADKVPAVLGILGIGNPAAGSTAGLHTPQFRIDEDVLHVGAALHVAFVRKYMGVSSRGGDDRVEL